MTDLLTLNSELAFSPQVQGGIAEQDYENALGQARAAFEAVQKRVASDELGFWNLPQADDDLSQEKAVLGQLPATVDHLVVLGIGGSSLGGRTIQRALGQKSTKHQLTFVDNIDPHQFEKLLENIDPFRTAFNVISKSGGTIETASQFVIARDFLKRHLGEEGYRERMIATTDPSQGALRALAADEGLKTLPIPSNVGGRFSVLSAVGTFPALFNDVDVTGILKGAAQMRDACSDADPENNPALKSALLHYLADTQCHRNIQVLMPYSSRLWELALWFVQLWGESLGKKTNDQGEQVELGPTPVPALGSTDQHSQLQLFMEGPQDKFVNFIEVADHQAECVFPDDLPPAYEYLRGSSMARLMKAESQGTAWALANAGRPSMCLTIPQVTAETLGALFFFFEAQTAFAGALYGINAFDQPGVEAGKHIAYGLMGREGFEDAVPAALRKDN